MVAYLKAGGKSLSTTKKKALKAAAADMDKDLDDPARAELRRLVWQLFHDTNYTGASVGGVDDLLAVDEPSKATNKDNGDQAAKATAASKPSTEPRRRRPVLSDANTGPAPKGGKRAWLDSTISALDKTIARLEGGEGDDNDPMLKAAKQMEYRARQAQAELKLIETMTLLRQKGMPDAAVQTRHANV